MEQLQEHMSCLSQRTSEAGAQGEGLGTEICECWWCSSMRKEQGSGGENGCPG